MALPTSLHLNIVSADRALVDERVDEVQIPGADGYFGVLPGHTPLLALLGLGELWYRQGSEKHFMLIGFGFAEVQPDRVTILAEEAEKPDEIDVDARRGGEETGGGAARAAWRQTWTSSACALRCSGRSSSCRSRLGLKSVRNCFPTSPTSFATAG